MKFIDLFCGIGAFHIALKSYGHECVFACDIDKHCRKIYEKNHKFTPMGNLLDIKEQNIPFFDILCAGFPCQSFSNAGNKKSMNDKRGLLFNEILRIVKFHSPKILLLENVKHIKTIDNGKVFKYILDELFKLEYNVQYIQLSPHHLGIPQQRERIFFIGIKNNEKNNHLIEYVKNIQIPNYNINFNIFEKNPNEKYFLKDDILNVLNAWDEIIEKIDTNEKLSPTIILKYFYENNDISKLTKWNQNYYIHSKYIYEKYQSLWDIWYLNYSNILSKRDIYSKLEWQAGPKQENDTIWNHFIQIRQSGIRVKKSKYFPTLVAIGQIPIYGKEKRYITPRECARLQSFPDTFILDENDKIAYKQISNSINVDVIKYILSYLFQN